MIYQFSLWLKAYSSLYVLHYVTVRIGLSLLSSFCLSLLFGRRCIEKSRHIFAARSRENTPLEHRKKDFTPTMGGVFVLVCILLNSLFWVDITQPAIWFFLMTLFGFGAIGIWDDWCKIHKKRGISAKSKALLQLFVAAIIVLGMLFLGQTTTMIHVPFFKLGVFDLGWVYAVWALFLIVGCSNAVNLTDGLDGLATTSLIFNFAVFTFISYLAGHVVFASYLLIPYTGTAELAVVGSIMIGSLLGFLWFNCYPAEIFMGDVGSLAFGSSLAVLALMTKQELLLGITGGLFVIETVSVIVQVVYFKLYKRRIFKMAPIHHHFELLGWHESKVVIRFSIITFLLCMLALVTLKLR